MSIITEMTKELWPYIISVFGIIVAFFYGKKQQKNKDTINKYKEREKVREVSNEINKEIDNSTEDDIRKRASKWLRNDE